MKIALIISLFFALSCSLFAQDAKSYGEKINQNNAISVVELKEKLTTLDKVEVKVAGVINASCAAKGCWMTVRISEDEEMRVRFKDYAFFVPTDGLHGKKVIIEGLAKRTITDVETLQHYAQDAGKSEDEIALITEPLEELSFEAKGVLIFD